MNIYKCKGIFYIKDTMFKEDFGVMLQIMSRVIICRCEYIYHQKVFEYHAYSPLFDEIPDSDISPTYEISYNQFTSEVIAKRLP